MTHEIRKPASTAELVESPQRNHPHLLRLDAYRIRGYQRGSAWRLISLRISHLWACVMRHRNCGMGRQEELSSVRAVFTLKAVKEPIDIVLPCRSKIKKWAFENAYMLTLVFILFAITWVAILVVGIKAYVK